MAKPVSFIVLFGLLLSTTILILSSYVSFQNDYNEDNLYESISEIEGNKTEFYEVMKDEYLDKFKKGRKLSRGGFALSIVDMVCKSIFLFCSLGCFRAPNVLKGEY